MTVTVSTHVLDTERGVPAAGVRVELWRGDELVGSGETDADGRIRELASGRARHATASSSTRRRRSSAASSSRSSSARATTTSRCSSPRTRARPTAAADRRGAGRALRGTHALRRAARGARRPARTARARSRRRSPTTRRRRCSTRTRRSAPRELSARRRREQGTDEAPELERAEPRLRGAVRLPLRRLRQPPPEERDRPDPARPARADARAGAGDRPRRARLDRRGPMAAFLALARLLVGLGRPRLPLAARGRRRSRGSASSFYFIALDNHLEPPAEERDAERGVGGEVWEIHGGGFYRVEKFQVAPERAPRPALLVQVGGVHDLALRVRAPRRRLLRARLDVPRRPRRSPTSTSWEAIALAIGGLVLAWLVYDGLCRLLGRDERALAVAVSAFVVLAAWGAGRALRAARRVHRGRRDARDDHGRRTSSS